MQLLNGHTGIVAIIVPMVPMLSQRARMVVAPGGGAAVTGNHTLCGTSHAHVLSATTMEGRGSHGNEARSEVTGAVCLFSLFARLGGGRALSGARSIGQGSTCSEQSSSARAN